MGLSPSLWGDVDHFAGEHLREAGEHVAEISDGIQAAPATALDDGVENGAALADLGGADEEPILFT